MIIFSNRGGLEGHEWIDIKRGKTSILIDDFRKIQIRKNKRLIKQHWTLRAKGHMQEIKSIIEKIKADEPSPISFEDIIMVSSMIFHARELFLVENKFLLSLLVLSDNRRWISKI